MSIQREIFSKRLREARTKSGYSMRKLAEKLGTTYVSVCQWENGVMPRDDAIDAICLVLNVEKRWLLGLESEKTEDWIYEIINATPEKKETVKKIWEIIKNL